MMQWWMNVSSSLNPRCHGKLKAQRGYVIGHIISISRVNDAYWIHDSSNQRIDQVSDIVGAKQVSFRGHAVYNMNKHPLQNKNVMIMANSALLETTKALMKTRCIFAQLISSRLW